MKTKLAILICAIIGSFFAFADPKLDALYFGINPKSIEEETIAGERKAAKIDNLLVFGQRAFSKSQRVVIDRATRLTKDQEKEALEELHFSVAYMEAAIRQSSQ